MIMPLNIDHARIAHDFDRGAVKVHADDGSEPIDYRISDEAIQDYTHVRTADAEALKGLYLQHSAAFDAAADMKFTLHQLEPDGSILVRFRDM
jgi:hypothetical protein